MRILLGAAAAALMLGASPLGVSAAEACTPAPGYRIPTNLELTAEANTIVFGQVVRALPATDPAGGAIEVRPLGAVKGLVPGETLRLQGMALREAGDPRAADASDPLDFAAPHQDALTGACIRRVFPIGRTVLFFLERSDGGWAPAGGPFSRWAENVAGPEDPWVQLVTLYARAVQVPPQEREALLQDQLEALQARADEPVAQAMAADIERAMAAPGFPRLPDPPPPPAPPAAAGSPVPVSSAANDDLGELGERIDALAHD